MTSRAAACAIVAACTFGFLLQGQQDPDVERGARPGLAYKLSDLDQVNLFNGTITINLPLGQAYPVGGTLSYSLQASYATNHWETDFNIIETSEGAHEFPFMYPSQHANAGAGWLVTLGAIIETPSGLYAYLAPDGGQHVFRHTLHELDDAEPDAADVFYTRDGTYLRIHKLTQGWQIRFPNGHVHTFSEEGVLAEIRDPFNNTVTLVPATQSASDPYPGSTLWTISDSAGRTHKVYFRPNWTYDEIPASGSAPLPIDREMVHKIELAAFAGSTATCTFNYIAAPGQPSQIAFEHKTSRRCRAKNDPALAGYVVTSLLSSISMPENVTYAFEYDRGDRQSCSYNAATQPLGASGNIVKLVLPSGSGSTGGRVEWTYQKYVFPGTGAPGIGPSINAGIQDKKVFDGTKELAVTSYTGDKITRTDLGPNSPHYDVWRRISHKDGTSGALINFTKHYFTVCRSSVLCGNGGEYGLPITRTQTHTGSGAFLSSEIEISPTSSRKTWLKYEGDHKLTSVSFSNFDQRVAYQRTEYEDGKFSDVTHSEFDGLGHYRKSVTGGNFGSGNTQTSHTNFNTSAGEFRLDSHGNLVAGFTIPAASEPWILNTFSKQWSSNGTNIASASFCFDTAGFLTSRRTFKNWGESPTATTTDLLAVFTRSTAGNLTEERYLGGDVGQAVPANFTCGNPVTAETYRLDHEYEHGVRSTTKYVVGNGSAMPFAVVDNDIDQNTGLIAKSRRYNTLGQNDGVTTEFVYDLLGRLEESSVKQPSTTTRQRIVYGYQVQPPKITVSDYDASSNLIRQSSAEFDVLGRLVRETRSMPGNVTASRTTSYNALGWVMQTADWGATAPTLYTRDVFGRPTRIQAPDQTEDTALQIAYSGVASVTRTSKVRTGLATLTNAVTTEEFDRQGRLWRVTEPEVATAQPVTQYEYDVAGRLASVCSNRNDSTSTCGQTRSFTYDNRGFLTAETHPENTTTTYPAYDARGHVRRRYLGTEGGPFDIGFDYDRAERLTQVYEANADGTSKRVLKHFTFGDDNSGSDRRIGRVTKARRFNWVEIGGTTFNVRVEEDYVYAGGKGEASSRKTSSSTCAVTATEHCTSLDWQGVDYREFNQSFTYDALGSPTTLTYPQCAPLANCVGPIGSRTVTNDYSNGLLTSVTWNEAGVENSISYHESGLVNEVTHDNGVVDETTVDSATPSRPTALITKNAEGSGCVIPAFTEQPKSTTIIEFESATLNAEAVGDDDPAKPVNYQWYKGTAPSRTNPLGTQASQIVTPAATTSYWVEAWNACSGTERTESVTATVTVCAPPSVIATSDKTITRSLSTTLTSVALGSTPRRFEWYTVEDEAETAITGATSSSLVVSPLFDTHYRVNVTNDCESSTDDVWVFVVDPPTTPSAVSASYNPATGKNDISWSAASSAVGIASYEIERIPDGRVFTTVSTAYADQTSLDIGKSYVYRIRAFDSQGVGSAHSAPDAATRIAFTTPDPIPSPSEEVTSILGTHVAELRQAIDAMRAAAGLNAAWTSYAAPTGPIAAAHFTEMRTKLNEARGLLLLPDVVFTDPVAPGAPIHRSCVNDLRMGVK